MKTAVLEQDHAIPSASGIDAQRGWHFTKQPSSSFKVEQSPLLSGGTANKGWRIWEEGEPQKPVWVFPVCNDPIDGKMSVRMCNRGFSVTGWEQLHNHSGERSRIRQPLLKDTCILGTSSSKRSEQGQKIMLYIKRKIRASLRIFDGRLSFCNYVHVANKAQ